MLSDEQLLRYSRQIMLSEVEIAGQERWRNSRVLIVGVGGLGCPAALYLASAGVGTLVLADDDKVELTNLQRQILHTTDRIGVNKVDSAEQALKAINPDVEIVPLAKRLREDELIEEVVKADIVLDCCDNFSTRYAINRACFEAGVPLVSGAGIRFEGQLTAFDPRRSDSPCYQCLYPDMAEDEQLSCARSGVFAPLVGMIGSAQAAEALKMLAGIGESVVGRLLLLDGLHMQWRSLKLSKREGCPVCSKH